MLAENSLRKLMNHRHSVEAAPATVRLASTTHHQTRWAFPVGPLTESLDHFCLPAATCLCSSVSAFACLVEIHTYGVQPSHGHLPQPLPLSGLRAILKKNEEPPNQESARLLASIILTAMM